MRIDVANCVVEKRQKTEVCLGLQTSATLTLTTNDFQTADTLHLDRSQPRGLSQPHDIDKLKVLSLLKFALNLNENPILPLNYLPILICLILCEEVAKPRLPTQMPKVLL